MKNLSLLFLLFLSSSSLHLLKAMPPMFEEGKILESSEHDDERLSSTTRSATASLTEQNRKAADAATSRAAIVIRGTSLSIATDQNSTLLPIEAGKYSDFLNALLPDEAQSFYNAILNGQENIISTAGPFTYTITAGREKNPLIISQTAALHYCNWLENGSLSYLEDPDSTEYGTYTLRGINGISSINPQASYFIPGDLAQDPDAAPVSQLGLVVFISKKTPSIKIPDGSSSINSRQDFLNADFIKEMNSIREEQAKWTADLKKALVKKSKRSSKILSKASKIKISLQQKISQLEEQLKSTSSAKSDQLTELLAVHERLLDTVKHTHNIVEARVALPFFVTEVAQKKLNEALQWARLTPEDREREFEIELYRKSARADFIFKEVDDSWKIYDTTWQAILDTILEEQKFVRVVQKARVDMDSLQQTVHNGATTASYLVDALNKIGSILGKLDSNLTLPIEAATEATHLVIGGVQVIFSNSISFYLSHLDKQEQAINENIKTSIIQRNALLAHARELEEAAINRDREETIQRGIMAKIESPVSDALTWELWGKRIAKSEENLTTLRREWAEKTKLLEERLPPIDHDLALITRDEAATYAALEEAERVRIIKEKEFVDLFRDRAAIASLTAEKVDCSNEALQNAYALWREQQIIYSSTSDQKEKLEALKEEILKEIDQTKALAKRKITRQEAFLESDKAAWSIVWPHRVPATIDFSEFHLKPAKKLDATQTQVSRKLVGQFTMIKGTFAELQSCWESFAEVFSKYLQNKKRTRKIVQKEAELFGKTATTVEAQIAQIVIPAPNNPFYQIAISASHVADASMRLKTVLEILARKVNRKMLAQEETVEHQLAFLRTHFSDKLKLVKGSVWIGETTWARETIDKLAELVKQMHEKKQPRAL